MSALQADQIVVLVGVALMLLAACAFLLVSRRPTAARLAAMERDLGAVKVQIDHKFTNSEHTQQFLVTEVGNVKAQLAGQHASLAGLKALLERVDRQQDRWMQSQMDREGRG